MIKYFLVPLMFFLMAGCGCPDDGEVNYLLTEFEKSLIPFSAATSVNFINENSEIITGSYTAKKNKIVDIEYGDDEDCYPTNIEEETATLNLPTFRIHIIVSSDTADTTVFNLSATFDTPELFALEDCIGRVKNLETKSMDIEVQGFMFANVFVFKKCNEDGQIDQILYSPKNGVEFIDFADGSYLKLN